MSKTMTEGKSSTAAFNVYGWMHTGNTLAALSDSHRVSLEAPGRMIGDEIVTMLLLNTGNTFHRVLESGKVVIVPIHLFYIWRALFEKDSKKEHPIPWKSLINFSDYHLIAYPVHTHNPLHFTLGMMIDLNWQKGPEKKWAAFHFDSFPCSPTSHLHAVEFGKHVLSLGLNAKVKEVEVPVIHQPFGSNDCGLYPSHFLDIILQDIDHNIDECLKMADERLSPDCLRVREFWKYHLTQNLRQQALSTFNFYMMLMDAIEEDKKQGFWSM